jgi:hypothetical protein
MRLKVKHTSYPLDWSRKTMGDVIASNWSLRPALQGVKECDQQTVRYAAAWLRDRGAGELDFTR